MVLRRKVVTLGGPVASWRDLRKSRRAAKKATMAFAQYAIAGALTLDAVSYAARTQDSGMWDFGAGTAESPRHYEPA